MRAKTGVLGMKVLVLMLPYNGQAQSYEGVKDIGMERYLKPISGWKKKEHGGVC